MLTTQGLNGKGFGATTTMKRGIFESKCAAHLLSLDYHRSVCLKIDACGFASHKIFHCFEGV